MQHDDEKQIITMENFTILLFYLSFTSSFIISMALDTIAPTETIRGSETIVSAGGTFEMGFFSPGISGYRYLGVWYKKIATGTVVWVANRETPLTDSSGVLKLNNSGILVLLNQNNTIIWSSSSSRVVHNPVAQLLDSGNLVIGDENDLIQENFLWQSFDYLDKTLIPEMKLGRTAKSLDTYLSSWKSSDDPSQGKFTLQLDPSGLQLIIKENSVVKFRSGPWNGIRFSGMPFQVPNSVFNYTFVSNPKEIYYTNHLFNSSVLTRVVLMEDGVIVRFTWSDRINDWVKYLTVPIDNCDNYAVCGAYGSCDIRNPRVCGCLDRFVPKYEKDWGRSDWSGGCVRRTPLDCQTGGDGFIRHSNVKLPEMMNFSTNASMTLEECRITCLKNCSCMAYSNSDIRGRGSGCYFWFGELIDIKQYTENGQDLYVRVASSEIEHQGSSNRKKKAVILASSVLTGMLLVGLGLSFFLWRKKKTLGRPRKRENCSMNNQEEDLELPHFDFTIIANATNNFSVNNMLGEGGFGPVYKGLLKEGQEVAVKRLSKDSRQGLEEFKNEVKCIAKLQHRNLVKLLGYCIQLEEKILVYEYMPNKSLDFYVFDETRSMSLDWSMRYHIINGISRGLLYLHQDSRLRIIHRDLKLSNILLDKEMNPKISDFGLARSFGGNETEANTNRVVGTYGYMSPEYAIDGLFSLKSDVFSFGVLVLEIVSGRRNRGFNHADHQLNLLGHAWILFKEGRFLELIDASIMESCNPSQVLRSVHVSLLCVQHCPEDRPSMSSVVLMLSGERALPEPKQPGFFTERKLIEAESSSSKTVSCSVNEVTITMIEVR